MKNNIKKIVLIFFIITTFGFAKNFKVEKTYELQSGSLKEYRLKNKIPVYINNSVPNEVASVYIVVDGGTILMPYENSGLEKSLFSMMSYGSKKYSYEDIKMLEYETQSSISSYTLYCGSAFYLNCINYYLDQMLPVFLDEFLNPAFNQSEYEILLNQINQKLQSELNDPESILFTKVYDIFYNDNPLKTTGTVNEDSIKNITLDNLKKHHKKILDASRLSVVIVGKVDIQKVLNELDVTLGRLKSSKDFIKLKKSIYKDERVNSSVQIKGDRYIMSHKAAEGSNIILRVFNSPSVKSDDYVPARITEDIFSTIMFNIVREKYGACYTPGSAIGSSIVPVGFDYGFRVSDMEGFYSYLGEAQQVLKNAKVISSYSNGVVLYDDLENCLEGYKNSYIVKKYSSQSTSSGIASRIVSSLLQFGDLTSSEELIKKVNDVTTSDVLRVFEKYWLSENCRWFEMR